MFVTLLALSLRLVNPHEVPVDAALRCGEATRGVSVGARAVVDVPDADGCTSADALLPLTLFSLTADAKGERQQPLGAEEEGACAVPALWLPSFACRNGTATAWIEAVDGATYEWTVEGATIVSGAGTSRVTLQITDPAIAKLDVRRSSDTCAVSTGGVIHVREPIVIRDFTVPQTANTDQPVTLRWSYDLGREPVSQLLTGDMFPNPIALPAAQRSYTFTPKSSGARTVELRASYAHVIPTALPKRRRATSAATATASECPSALASAKMNVSGCVDEVLTLDAPEDVAAGSTFMASVPLTGNQKAEWSVEGGTVKSISTFTETVEVTAGTSGRVRLTARVEQKPGCFVTAEAEVPILLAVEQCTTPPTATLSTGLRDCDRVQVVAEFTGTPPFRGLWSDGAELHVSSNRVVRELRRGGIVTLTQFRDAACYGRPASAETEDGQQSVRLELIENRCGIARVVAHFSGTPPFTGYWAGDYTRFSTTERRLERTVKNTGPVASQFLWQVVLEDAGCKRYTDSWTLMVDPVPVARAGPYPVCQTKPHEGAWVAVYAERYRLNDPVVAEWTDGVVSVGTIYGVGRRVPPIVTPSEQFTLRRVLVGGCEADLEHPTATILNRPTAQIAPTLPGRACAGEQLTARIHQQPSSESVLRWSLRGNYAMAAAPLDGKEFTFTSRLEGNVALSLFTEHGDGMCNSQSREVHVWFDAPADVLNVKLDPATIPRGGVTRITWETEGRFFDRVKVAVPPERAAGLTLDVWGATYADTTGPGTVPITFTWSDCRGSHTKAVHLTVTP